jgi:hypothetical protein
LTSFEIGSLIAAGLSLPLAAFSVVFAARSAKEAKRQADEAARAVLEAKRQADEAERAVLEAQQAAQSAAVIHFASRFFDLMGGGEKFEDLAWAYHYWSLHATEFYFFDNNLIPRFMYELWMVELVFTYRDKPLSKESHQKYVERYAFNYPDMATFFNELARISEKEFSDDVARHKAITNYVVHWKDRHSRAS